MKKQKTLKALVLSLAMAVGMLLPMTTNAQSDGFFRGGNDSYENRATIDDDGGMGHWGIGETVPVGSGLLILTFAGAGYAIARRKRSYMSSKTHKTYRHGATLFLALMLVLGMTNCKKKLDTIQSVAENGSVQITLDVEGDNSKVIVDPTGSSTYATVTFETGDIIYVGYNNEYVGCLTYSEETQKFSGSVSIAAPVGEQPLHFYFLGGKDVQPDPSEVSNNKLSVVISDQTSKYPVVSYAHSKQIYAGEGKYSAKLVSKCSIIKFNVTTPSTSPICITGMNNKATVNFSTNAFSYDKEGDGVIKMKGVASSGDETWAIVLQQDALTAGAAGTAYTADFSYNGARAAIPEITMNQYLNEDRAMTVSTYVWDGDLSKLTNSSTEAFATARNGMRIYNSIAAGVKTKVSIAAGATVTLDNATITYTANGADHAGLTCIGDATIILADGTTNTIVGGLDSDGYSNWPGIFIPAGSTLTINGNTGVLNARRGGEDVDFGSPAGIGAAWRNDGGNIVINGGVINAEGGAKSAGIGGTCWRACGDITINGGTITATGHKWGTGIGLGGTENANSFYTLSGGNITITGGTVIATGGEKGAGIGTGTAEHKSGATMTITLGNILISGGNVTATGGQYGAGIGTGHSEGDNRNNCGTITIEGGTVTATGGENAPGIGCGHKNQGNYNSECGAITISGGTVTATGGAQAAGIGCGYHYVSGNAGDLICGDITITSGVTSVTATKGSDADNCIGVNKVTNQTTCTKVTIGGTVYWGPAGATYYYANGGDTYLTESPCVYPKP